MTKSLLFSRLVCAATAAAFTASVLAQPAYSLADTLAAYQSGRYAEAAPGLVALSNEGDPQAQAYYCEASFRGLGVPKHRNPLVPACYAALEAGVPRAMGLVAADLLQFGNNPQKVQGAVLARKGVDAGDAFSTLVLARAYYFGDIAGGSAKAAPLFEALVAKEGNPTAHSYLGYMYATGDGVAKNVPRGIALLERAEQAGIVEASRLLGHLYAVGQVVPQDLARAVQYLARASGQGDSSASFMLYTIYSTAANRDELRGAAAAALKKAVDGGNGSAQAEYGALLLQSAKNSQQVAQAREYLKAAHQQGVPEGSLSLALSMLDDAKPDYVSVDNLLTPLIKGMPTTDVGTKAAIAMAWPIAAGHIKGTEADVQYLLGLGDKSPNSKIAQQSARLRADIDRVLGPRGRARPTGSAESAAAALVAGLLLMAILSPDSSSSSDSPSWEAAQEKSRRDERRSSCQLNAYLCTSNCGYSLTEKVQVCRNSCPSSC